jgi:GntR family transcriptional repressor for pyruvate dehydrogenase complex
MHGIDGARVGVGAGVLARGEGAINEDFAFHRAIAAASGNPRFAELLEFLGRHVIPRQSVRVSVGTPQAQRQYLIGIQKKQGRIYEVIRAGQPAEARKAMRTHLAHSLQRYRRLAEGRLRG